MKASICMGILIFLTNLGLITVITMTFCWMGFSAGEALLIWLCICGGTILFLLVKFEQIEKRERENPNKEEDWIG